MPNRTPPQADDIEISVFGPSYGEAIVAKVSESEWIAVDSCKNEETGVSKPLEYLRSINVDVERDLKVVIASYWHRDHIGGMSQLVEAAKSAEFVCPLSFRNKEFMTYAEMFGVGNGNPIVQRSSELIRTLKVLKDRGVKPIFVGQDRRLFKSSNGTTVYTMSPGDDQVAQFIADIGGKMIAMKGGQNPSDSDPNHTAIVLMLNFPGRRVLLGADLEEQHVRGWSTIIASSKVERDSIQLFKIPHHGSLNAHHQGFWTDHISAECLAVLTPFASGENPPPTADDVKRILAHTPQAFSAARATSLAPAKEQKAHENQMEDDGVSNRRRKEPKMGHVRFRTKFDPKHAWTVQKFGNAVELKDVFG